MNANRARPLSAGRHHRFGLCLGLLAALLLASAVSAGEATDAVKRYQDDLRLLNTKIGQYRYRLKSSREGEQQLAELEQALAKLKTEVDEIAELAGELDNKDSRLHYLKEWELGPKEREIDRVKQAHEQRYEQLSRQLQAVNREWDWWATQKHKFAAEEHAAYQAAWVQYNRIKALDDAYQADRARAEREMQEEFDRAVAAYTKAQQELGETATKREQVAEKLGERTASYAAGRSPIVEQLVALDNTPVTVNVPLTPFSNGVPPGQAGTMARVKPPVGPGLNTRALDQLQVVTASSRTAAARDDQDKDNGLMPPGVAASTISSYGFDTGGGTGVAPLPEVTAPAAPAVPLVLPPAAAEREDAPAPVRANPNLQKLAANRVENVRKLDELYAARRVLVQQGAAASPAEWTKVVQDISATHSAIAVDVVKEKLAEGSQKIDAQITLRPQRKRISDIVVPPPDTTPAQPPPK